MPIRRGRQQGNAPDPATRALVLPFPVRGVDHSLPVAQQPELTCPDALNAVGFPSLSDRQGGGKRDGTSKECVTLLPSEIFHLQIFLPTQTATSASGGGMPESWSEMNMGLNGAGIWLGSFEDLVGVIGLHVGGDFTLAGGATAERFGIYNTETGGWTDPANSFSTAMTVPGRALLWDAGDGSGLCLYVVGGTGSTPTLRQVSRWDGSTWTDMTVANGSVTAIHAITVFQNCLYVAGNFTAIGNASNDACNNIAYWNPHFSIGEWLPVGVRVSDGGAGDGVTGGVVYCMASMGTSLFVGGTFTACKGAATACNRMAEFVRTNSPFSGSGTWAPIGGNSTLGPVTSGIGTPLCMTVGDIGNGTKLYIGGSFGNMNGDAATEVLNPATLPRVAGTTASDHSMITSWDGHTLSPLISGIRGRIGSTVDLLDFGVLSMEVFNDGNGPALYVAGRFDSASTSDGLGIPAPSIARWDGTQWTAPAKGLAGGLNQSVRHMIPAGPARTAHLYATGSFTIKNNVAVNGLAEWDGAEWVCLAGAGCPNPSFNAPRCALRSASALLLDPTAKLWIGLAHSVPATYPHLLGSGPAPPVPGSKASRYSLSTWNGTMFGEIAGWTDRSNNPSGILDANIGTTGNKLYVTGGFTEASGGPRNYIARWDGSTWAGLGANAGESALQAAGSVLATNGTVLYCGGSFTKVTNTGAVDVANTKMIAKWTASTNTWSAMTAANTSGTSVDALYWDSGAALLYIGGLITLLGAVANTKNVGTFDPAGPTYAPLDQGLNGQVLDIKKFGSDIYACGVFTADQRGTAMNYIAKWNAGTTRWVVLGGGLTGGDAAHCMFVHDDGTGSALYVGGNFTAAVNGSASIPCNGIARWDGTTWSAVDRMASVVGGFGSLSAAPRVTAMVEHGGNLVCAGGFTDASGDTATYLARGEPA